MAPKKRKEKYHETALLEKETVDGLEKGMSVMVKATGKALSKTAEVSLNHPKKAASVALLALLKVKPDLFSSAGSWIWDNVTYQAGKIVYHNTVDIPLVNVSEELGVAVLQNLATLVGVGVGIYGVKKYGGKLASTAVDQIGWEIAEQIATREMDQDEAREREEYLETGRENAIRERLEKVQRKNDRVEYKRAHGLTNDSTDDDDDDDDGVDHEGWNELLTKYRNYRK